MTQQNKLALSAVPAFGFSGLPPMSAGAGLKHEHAAAIFAGPPAVDFFEIHAENYMGAGGPPHRLLADIAVDYPLSIHGVGLSIGGAEPLDSAHLRRLRTLLRRYQPALFSEHLAWSTHEGAFLNDLLPLPYNEISLAYVCSHIDEVQDAIGMQMLLENPSTYVIFRNNTMTETEFLREVARRTGCGLLLDVNNVHVSATNHGFDAVRYINEFPIEFVGEIHLGGFGEDRDSAGMRLLIDDHGAPVSTSVWDLYRQAIDRCGPIPTLIEWDNNVPGFSTLAEEVARVRTILSAEQRKFAEMAAA